jgi:hypothetical protein
VGFRLRQIEEGSKFIQHLTVDALSQVVPNDVVLAVLEAEGLKTKRERKLNLMVMVYVVIGMGLFPALRIGNVMNKLAKGLRYIWEDPDIAIPGDSALSYRRDQLGARPIVELFRRICRPIATPETPGAFLFGLRGMAIDGTTEDMADSPENAAVYGRHSNGRGDAAYPQIQGVYLVECGTRAIVDAGFWPCHTSERVGGFRMLRSLTEGMLVMWDRGFHDFNMIVEARKRSAHVLSRLPAHVQPKRIKTLSDGSYLAYLYPSDYQQKKRGDHCRVRIIEYTITHPDVPGYGETHRLVTTLLDPVLYPGLDLACAYHERWEIELVIDEIDTHQRLSGRPLRSQTPVRIIQELYGLLIAHFIVRFLMHQAAINHSLDPDRLSFTHALELIRDAVDQFQQTARDQLGSLHQRLLRDIAAKLLPKSRLRSNPRVVKRKMSKFQRKRPENRFVTIPLDSFDQVVALI